MTPMIDVVFQLIVFFTATSTIAKTEFSLNIELPVAETGKDREAETQKRKITANVSADGIVTVAGRSVAAGSFQELIEAELLEHSADQIEIQFRADRAAPFRSVQPFLLVCARAGVWQVGFVVRRPEHKASD